MSKRTALTQAKVLCKTGIINTNSYQRKLASIEVQDEERSTSPAILRSSSSHTPYSKDTSGTPTTTSPTRECEWNGGFLERGEGGPFYSPNRLVPG